MPVSRLYGLTHSRRSRRDVDASNTGNQLILVQARDNTNPRDRTEMLTQVYPGTLNDGQQLLGANVLHRNYIKVDNSDINHVKRTGGGEPRPYAEMYAGTFATGDDDK